MPDRSPVRNPVRLALVGLLSVATALVLTGIVTVPAGTAMGITLLFAVVVTDLLHDLSPDTPDPSDEPQPPDGLEPDLATDSLLLDNWRETSQYDE
jgi:hypothetical protein